MNNKLISLVIVCAHLCCLSFSAHPEIVPGGIAVIEIVEFTQPQAFYQNKRVMIIGEAPGANEDIEGIPFCGQSGKLLDQIFDSVDLVRSRNLYIANAIFWRPPGNRKPTAKELAICRPFVEKHISLIKPKLIVACGSSALASLLPDLTTPITKLRGKMLDYDNQFLTDKIKLIPIFHPSFLLRQPSRKKSAWEDMITIKNFIN